MKNRNRDAYHFDDDEVEDGRSVRVPIPALFSISITTAGFGSLYRSGRSPH